MGISARSRELANAAGGFAACSGIARSAVAFSQDSRGATAIEYAMIAGLIAVTVVTAIDLVGTNLYNQYFSKIAGSLL